jgi:2,3-bisphosphoglycerate-dependent phosphoglycerate mutase
VDLLLIRHAQSANNQLWDRTGGSRGRSPDPEITELGRLQADAVARTLASGRYGISPRHLYTSLMLRAVQTAAPIADALDLPLLGHRETFEVFGPVEYHPDDPDDLWPHPGAGRESLTAVSPRLVWPDAPVAAAANGSGWWPGPVERMDQVPGRARRVIAGLIETHSGTDDLVALVTHGTFTQYLLRELLGIPEMAGWISIANTSLCLFRAVASPDRPVLAAWVNRFDHLEVDLFSE